MESRGGGLFPSSPPPPPPPPPPPGREGAPPPPQLSIVSASIKEEPPQVVLQPSVKEEEGKKERLQPVAQRSPSGRWNRYDTRLGVGSFKQVFLGLDAQEAKEVAWNTIKLGCLTANDRARVQAEVALLTRLKHQNILVMYDTWIDDETQELYLITSRMANTLKEHVEKLHPLQPAVIKKFCRQILSALLYLHQGVADSSGEKKPIIHRDLKCDNIFIDGPTGDIKVGDFGLAEFFDRGLGEDGKQVPATMEGTLGFIAPELLQEQPYTERVDIYAFGMCVLEMATNEYPFAECGNKFMSLLQKSAQNLQPEALAHVQDPGLKKLIEQCLLPAEQRPSAKELLENTYYPLNDESIPPSLEVEARLSTSLDMILRIALKIGMNGVKKTIQFDYDISKDTPTSLAREILADVLKDQQFADLEPDIVAKLTDAVKPAIKKLRHRQLTELLQKLELESTLMDLFAKEEITIVDLPLLQESDWDRLGVPLGPRRRLQQYLTMALPPSPAGLNPSQNGSFNSSNSAYNTPASSPSSANAGMSASAPSSPIPAAASSGSGTASPGLVAVSSSPNAPSSPHLGPSSNGPISPIHTSLPPSSPTLASSFSSTNPLPAMPALPRSVTSPIPVPATPTSAARKVPGPPIPSPETDELTHRLSNTSFTGVPPPGPPPPPTKKTT